MAYSDDANIFIKDVINGIKCENEDGYITTDGIKEEGCITTDEIKEGGCITIDQIKEEPPEIQICKTEVVSSRPSIIPSAYDPVLYNTKSSDSSERELDHLYTNQEYLDMILMYGEFNQNMEAAARVYCERFPRRYRTNARTILAAVQRVRDTGSVKPKVGGDEGGRRRRRIVNAKEEVLALMEESPDRTGFSQPIGWKIPNEYQYHPYHVQRVQALTEADYSLRLRFCQSLLNMQHDNPNFLADILFTNEASFTRNGMFNMHNTHQRDVENPHAMYRYYNQRQFSINVWAGIIGDQILGPFILPQRLNSQAYLYFLREDLPQLLENVPLDVRQRMWFQCDGAPAHFDQAVRNFLNNQFPGRWIGCRGPVALPPRSPDLTPLDFFLLGHLKNLVYATPVNDINELMNRINVGAQSIRDSINMERIRGGLTRRLNLCIEEGGGNFDHFL